MFAFLSGAWNSLFGRGKPRYLVTSYGDLKSHLKGKSKNELIRIVIQFYLENRDLKSKGEKVK